MKHVVLLGDSIFDNAVYVAPEPDVSAQLRARLGSEWEVTLLALDGDVVAGVERQLDGVPEEASHLIVSVGGNDALGTLVTLREPVVSVSEGLARLAEIQDHFRQAYARMVDAVCAQNLPMALCTIYESDFPEPDKRLVVAALALFNDVISRAAFVHRLPLIDLRLICTEPADYANPIEPSARGGEKIASAIAGLVTADPFPKSRSTVWF